MKEIKDTEKKETTKRISLHEIILGAALIGSSLHLGLKKDKELLLKKSNRNHKINLVIGFVLMSLYYYQIHFDEEAFFPIYISGLIGGYFVGKSLANIKFSMK